jgi:hypothetical protein
VIGQGVHKLDGDAMGLLSPVDWRARRVHVKPSQSFYVLRHGQLRLAEEPAVPHGVQIRRLTEERHAHFVASEVVVIDGMQRLMQIANEVHQQLQRLRTLGLRPATVA